MTKVYIESYNYYINYLLMYRTFYQHFLPFINMNLVKYVEFFCSQISDLFYYFILFKSNY